MQNVQEWSNLDEPKTSRVRDGSMRIYALNNHPKSLLDKRRI